MLERDDIGSAGRDRYMIAMKKAVDAPGEARDDYAIFSDLAERLGREGASIPRTATCGAGCATCTRLRGRRRRSTRSSCRRSRNSGSRDTFEVPRPREPQVSLDRFRADPVAFPLGTPSGRIEIYSERIASFGYDDCPGHPVWQEPAEWLGSPAAARYPLHLISNQPHTKLHSQYDHGAVSLASKIQGREPIAMHPADAAARGLASRATSCASSTTAARASPGCASTTDCGPASWRWRPARGTTRSSPARIGTLDKHGNPNVLTLDKGSSKLGQGCIAHSCLVEVERYAGELPPITAYDPPAVREARRDLGVTSFAVSSPAQRRH